MKFASTNIIELVLDKRYSIKMYCFNNTIKAYSKDLQSLKEWSGLVLGLPINMFIWMTKRSAWASSRFSLNPTTLEVKYLEGLKGGGACVLRKKNATISSILSNDQSILNELRENQKKALELAENISQSMKEMTIEHSEVLSLEKINPHKCAGPYVVAMKLLENFDATECWTQPEYFEVRAAVASIARKFLLVYFIKNQNVVSMTELDKKDKISKFDKVIKIINRNEKLLPELCTLVEVEIIKKLIYEAHDTQKWWQKILKESKEVLTVVVGLRNLDPVPALMKVVDYFDRTSNKLRGGFHKYAFQFEIFEKENAESTNLQEQTQCLIEKELEKINQLGWEEAHILLDFFENCMKKEKISEAFVLNVLKTHLPNIKQNKAWQIKEKVVNILRSLRGHWNSDIFQTANKLHEAIKLDEKDSRVEIILGLSPKILDKPRESLVGIFQQKEDFITNKEYSTDLIVGREEIIQEIHKRLQNNNICEITGMGGMGKTSVALKYADDFKKCYQIIWVIKSDSITLDLVSLATQLGICKDNDTLENFKIFLKSQKIVKSVLLIFDNLEEKTQLNDYYVTSENIKYLITSRSTDWEERIELGPLSYTKSEDYLRLRLVEHDENEESIKALAQRWNGFALGLRQSVASIKKNKFSIQEYLELIQDLTEEEATAKTLESVVSKINEETLELLSYFQPQDIPEDSIKTILVEKFGVKEWGRIRSQLIGCYIVNINSKRKWSIHQIIMEFIRSKNKGSMKDSLIHYYYKNFKVDRKMHIEKIKLEQIKELLPHVKNFVKEKKLDSIKEIYICYNLIHAILELEFDFEEAKQILEKMVDKANKISGDENKEDISSIFEYIGEIFIYLANYERSEEFYLKCLNIREQILQPLHPDLASIYNNMGALYSNKEDYTKSEEFYLKCLNINEQILQPLHPDLASIYNNMGNLYSDKADYTKSEEFYLKCLNIQEQILQPLHPDLASIYNDMGVLCRKKADYTKSEEFYLKCLNIQEQILQPLHPDLASIYNNMANLYGDKLDHAKWKKFYFKFLEIQQGFHVRSIQI
ncbi:hypothetical protein SteCoe_17421 [Stentor coeruleus]|uniref:NB-ARC domain-containing protein n=1 Tax=Stentor coeruleus TaxID=5963 RepID=A0A1R2BZ07_9CILI|nr:hypothetical protein SteCoe_17421 [Stentor coeruleus]